MAKAVPIYTLTQTDSRLRDNALVLVVRLQEMLDFAEAIRSPQNIQELHNLRIAAKRLRYTLELFAPVLGSETVAPLLAQVTEIQERIGAIHDCDVLFPLIQETLEREVKGERKKRGSAALRLPPVLAAEGLAALMARKRAERSRLYTEFLTFWDALPPEKLAADLAQRIASVQETEAP